MRDIFAIIYLLLIVLLGICGIVSRRSDKAVAMPVSYLLFAFIIPIAGNLILVLSQNELFSTIGCYTYFIGMDLMAFCLFDFTLCYCSINWRENRGKCSIVYTLLTLDILQYLFNPFFGHAFGTEPIMVDNTIYYRLVPYIGQIFHRIIVYGAFATSLTIFIVKAIRVPRIYAEKYYVILFTMILAGCWQTYYIFSRTPIDSSMIGIAVCGILIFYFSLFFRPFRLLDRMLANIASKIPEAIFFFDASDRCIWTNSNGLQLLQLQIDRLEVVRQRLAAMFEEFGEGEENWSSRQTIGSGKEARSFSLEKHLVTDSRNRKVGSFLSIRDLTEDMLRHQSELYTATHDSLTDLYTKEFLYESIHKKVTKYRDNQYWIAYIDIKDFKLINDIFGNEMGDDVLKRVANWMRNNAASTWVYGRLSGDAFGICFPASEPHLELAEQQLSKFVISNGTIDQSILMHVGIYKIIDPDIDVSIMFDRAHLALTSIKNEYNTHVAVYDDNMRNQVLWDQKISSQLERALEEKQICPYLQPIVDISGKIIGAEALVRWIHPEEGFLPPIKFIPVFEKNGMIAQVDKFIWRSACEALASWKSQPDKNDKFISVNISPKDFYFMDVFAEIQALIKEYDIEPKHLRIEITETVMMNEAENRMAILNRFRNAGFIVEMDDFGSGYSSLNQLKDMPLDVLKIDMKFLGKSKDDKKATTILRNVIRLSDDLGLSSLTEGVETESQYKMLSEMGCHLFQGYYFAKPMPVKEFEDLCSKQGETK